MSISTELTRMAQNAASVSAAKTSIAAAITAKGGTVGASDGLEDFAAAIAGIPSGGRPVLPTGYTALKYLQSTGTQNIDIGIPPDNDTVIDVTFLRMTNGSSGYTSPISSAGGFSCSAASATVNAMYYKFGSTSEKSISGPVPAYLQRFLIDKDSIKIYDGVLGYELFTGALGSTSMPASAQSIKIFGTSSFVVVDAKIYVGGEWYKFVPAKRDSDNELGMYETEHDEFYINAGAGSFIGGEY